MLGFAAIDRTQAVKISLPVFLAAGLLLGLLPAPGASNTLLRFTYYHGTVSVGSMDVELFDQDKPVTVSNFLRYVRTGAYDNLMLHRVATGFVMQAGLARVPDPRSTYAYAGYYETPNYGSITNEFTVGPRYSNVVGTLAMARAIPRFPESQLTFEERVAGTNSASTDWYINLADNSATLDTNWGGFTVFGRVIAGHTLLDFFNRQGPTLSTMTLGGLANVPVAYPAQNPPRFPRYVDLYHVRIAEFPATDNTRPTVSITSPAQGSRLTNLNGTVRGKASDASGVTSLWAILNGVEFNVGIEPGAEWGFQASFRPGTNYLWLQSVDGTGLRSAYVYRTWFNSLLEPLSLTVNGPGVVTGATNGQLFEVERALTLQAVPAPGHVFAGWNGTTTYQPATAHFLMYTNAKITATFVPNPFPALKGSYSGLFYNTNFSRLTPFRTQPPGAMDFTVTDQGKVSGKLRILGRSLPFSGNLSAYGKGRFFVAADAVAPYFSAWPRWSIIFDLNTTNVSDQIRGGYVTDDETFASAIAMERVWPGSATNPSPYLGNHTLALTPGTNSAQPQGWGFASAKVSSTGVASVRGTLADGTPFTQSGPVLAASGLWPFYVTPYIDKGWLYGWLQMQPPAQPGGDIAGSLVWRKNAQPGKPYPSGFEFYPAIHGSHYPTPTNRILNFASGIVSAGGPNLQPAVTNQVSVGLNNTITNLSPNRLSFTITKPTGLFSGSVQPPGETRTVPFKGVLLPSLGLGVGFYLSTNLSGGVYFGE
ncbi:MAG: hypothetical protein RJA22_1225 [Verrucomicrobiota bacterium]|jgi:cyclophilin family peptidyl-prolyl cis-trans isomerase